MCRDRTIHMRTIVTCNRDTEFGFEASQDTFQLIVGAGGLSDGAGGSSLHLHMYNATILLPRLIDVLQLGQQALEGVVQHPVPQTVRWPTPGESARENRQR